MPPQRNQGKITGFFRPQSRPVPPPDDSDSSSKRRIWPSPRKERHSTASRPDTPASPTPAKVSTASVKTHSPLTTRTPPPAASANASFSSLSLPSQPSQPLSAASLPASERIVKNGKETVPTSDPEDESDSSLEELGALLSRGSNNKKPAVATRSTQNSKKSTLSSIRRFDSEHDRIIPAAKPQLNNQKYSLKNLAALSKKDNEAEAKVAEAKAALAAPAKPQRMEIDGEDDIEARIVATAFENEEDAEKAQQVLQALKRTDALHLDTVYHFFDEILEKMSRNKFPSASLPDAWKSSAIKHSETRKQLFLSGFVSTWVGMQSLPDEVLLWMVDEVCAQPLDELSLAYIKVLEGSGPQLKELLTSEHLNKILRGLGAKAAALDSSSPMQTTRQVPNTITDPPHEGLTSFLHLISALHSSLTPSTQSHLILLTLRLLLSHTTQTSPHLTSLTQSTLTSLLTSLPAPSFPPLISHLTTTLTKTLTHAPLQSSLVSLLPATSPVSQTLKRALATSFFLAEPLPTLHPLYAADLNAEVLAHLTGEALYTEFTAKTDYAALAAKMQLLDISVDAGFGLPLLGAGPGATKAFNTHVDSLSLRLRAIEGRIQDAGATNMARREAKDAVSSVKFRVEGSVRKGERVKRGIFARDGEDEGRRVLAWAKSGKD